MLLKQATLRLIRSGEVDRQFRRWRRPTVKTGGTLHTSVGVLRIVRVAPVDEAALTEDDARRAGHSSLEDLWADLERRTGATFRIDLHFEGDDPRVALREAVPTDDERSALADRLDAMDAASKAGPWAWRVLSLIASREGVRAPDLAPELGLEVPKLKERVRRLKALGLTESLPVGYRLSRRGRAVLAAHRAARR